MQNPPNRRARRRRRPVVATEPAPGRQALTVPETAWRLNCSPNTVWTLVRDGELASFKLRGKRLIAAAEVDAYIVRAAGAAVSALTAPSGAPGGVF